MIHNTGTGNTHIQFTFRLTNTVERTCHKGIILYRIGKYHQLGTAQAILISSDFRSFLDDFSHLGDSVHIDAGLGGAYIDTGANTLGSLQCLGDGVHQDPVALGTSLLHQGRKTANEVDTAFLGCLVHGNCQRYIGIRIAAIAHNGDGGNRDTLIDNGDTKLPFDFLANLHKILRFAGDLVIDPLGANIHILMGAIQKGDAHSDGTDIQVTLVDHILSG